jgi:TrmH family RNA methyltransferase
MAQHTVLSSPRNPLLKEIRRAAGRGALVEGRYCVAESFHLLEEALKAGLETPYVLAAASVQDVVSRQVERLQGVRLLTIEDSLFAEVATTEASQGVIALVRTPAWTLDHVFRGRTLALVLDGVQDPGNAGTMVRAAEAFGASGVLFLKGTVSPWNPKTLRASAGSLFRLPCVEGVDAANGRAALAQQRLDVYTAVPRGGRPVAEADLKRKCALIIGSEGRGVSAEMTGAGEDIHIPTTGVESLNAAVAASVLLYEAWRQRSAP